MLRISKRLVVYNIQTLRTGRADVYRLFGRFSDKIHDAIIWYKPNGQPSNTEGKISNTYEFVLLLKPDGVDGVSVNKRFMRNVVVETVNVNPWSKVHGAVMSEKLCSTLIDSLTFENELVCDPFMGCGTTAVVCDKLNRRYIGSEKEQKYIDIANERLEESRRQIRWF